ncbi:hypothetical protein QCA50_007951 [Cerrena zonata]|uniref:Retrotransposon gag domain-containing protein n=1 Tax=Cerrena zonata TaxID=2478898 RepID=A0AAW0GJP5_9APHY
MNRDLGACAYLRLSGRAKQWWTLISVDLQRKLMQSWWHFLEGIKDHFFTPAFRVELQNKYDSQEYRQRGHEHETPYEFVYRRIILHRHVVTSLQDPMEEIEVVMLKAPSSWSMLLHLDDPDITITGFVNDMNRKSKELINLAKLSDSRYSHRDASLVPKVSRRAYSGEGEPSTILSESDRSMMNENPASTLNGNLLVSSAFTASQDRKQPSPRRPPNGPKFPRDDSVVSRNKPSRPCKVCGSPYHYDRDCARWKEWEVKRSVNQIDVSHDIPASDVEEIKYSEAYCVLVLDNVEQASRTYEWAKALQAEAKILRATYIDARQPSCEDAEDAHWSSPLPSLNPEDPVLLRRTNAEGIEIDEADQSVSPPFEDAINSIY